jgi:hypothetical protein
MNPRDILGQIHRDVDSRPGVAVAVVMSLAVGLALWVPVIAARWSAPTTDPCQSSISVLSDPFDSQTK